MKRLPEWRLLHHPADVRIEVTGENPEKLFLNAAKAMTSLLTGPGKSHAPNIQKNVTIKSDLLDILLADWLREILFYFWAENFILSHASLRIEDEYSLEARLSGYKRLGTDELVDGLEIKGVTYHGLTLDKKPEGYIARIIFDV